MGVALGGEMGVAWWDVIGYHATYPWHLHATCVNTNTVICTGRHSYSVSLSPLFLVRVVSLHQNHNSNDKEKEDDYGDK